MNNRLLELRVRRAELQAQIARQREQLSEYAERWKAPLTVADQGVAVARFMRGQPVLVGTLAALLVLRRRGLKGLLRGGISVWRNYRLLRVLAAKLTVLLDTNHRV